MGGKTTAPAFPLYGGDWLKGTQRLSGAERGYYIDILLFLWDADEPFPTDEREQMQIVRCTDRREWRQAWHRIRGKFVELDGGAGFMNRRVEKERVQLKEARDRRAGAGRLGAERRWHLNGEQDGKAIAEHMAMSLAEPVAEPVAKTWPSISPSERADPKERDQLLPAAPTRELLTLFDELHQQRFESKAEINGAKDAQILAALCRKRGAEEVERLIRAFFELRDPWVLERGFSVGIFKTQIPKLLAKKPRRDAVPDDWFEECQRLHSGKCNGRMAHANQVFIDAQKGQVTAS